MLNSENYISELENKVAALEAANAALEKHSPFRAKNRIKIRLVGPDGVIKQEFDHVENIMATYGLNWLCERIVTGGEASSWVQRMGIGTSTTAAASDQASLIASTASVHISDASMDASDAGNMSCNFQATFAANNPAGAAAIHEVGLFGGTALSGSMIARSVLGTASINKGASDSIQITHQVVFTTG
jgi:hypothetical protein